MQIFTLELPMPAPARKPPKTISKMEGPRTILVRVSEDVHRMLLFVTADTGETMGEAAERLLLAGGLKEAATKAKA